MATNKRKGLSLDDRVKVLDLSKERTSARQIAAKFGVGKTQIQSIVKQREEFMVNWLIRPGLP